MKIFIIPALNKDVEKSSFYQHLNKNERQLYKNIQDDLRTAIRSTQEVIRLGYNDRLNIETVSDMIQAIKAPQGQKKLNFGEFVQKVLMGNDKPNLEVLASYGIEYLPEVPSDPENPNFS